MNEPIEYIMVGTTRYVKCRVPNHDDCQQDHAVRIKTFQCPHWEKFDYRTREGWRYFHIPRVTCPTRQAIGDAMRLQAQADADPLAGFQARVLSRIYNRNEKREMEDRMNRAEEDRI